MRRGVGARLERGKDDFVGNCVLVVVLDLRGVPRTAQRCTSRPSPMLTTPDFCFARISSWSALALASEAGATIFAHGPRSPARKRSALTGSSFGGRAAPGAAGAPVGGGSQNPAMRSVGVAGGESAPNVSGVIGVDHPSSSGAACGSSSAPGGGSSSRASSASRGGPDASSPEDGAAARRRAPGTSPARGSSSGRAPVGSGPSEAAVRHAQRRLERPLGRPRHRQSGEGRNGEKKSPRGGGSLSQRVVRPGRDFSLAPRKSPRARDADAARARAEIERAPRGRTRAPRSDGAGERSRGGAGGGGSGRDLEARLGCPEVFFNRARKHATGAGHTDEKSPI